jgi:hypothetical protein
MLDKVGKIAFIIGIVICIIAGLISGAWIYTALTILGLVVGFLNVGAKEVKTFLLAAISLVIIAAFGAEQIGEMEAIGEFLGKVYQALLVFVCPAAIIVALKSLFEVSKD